MGKNIPLVWFNSFLIIGSLSYSENTLLIRLQRLQAVDVARAISVFCFSTRPIWCSCLFYTLNNKWCNSLQITWLQLIKSIKKQIPNHPVELIVVKKWYERCDKNAREKKDERKTSQIIRITSFRERNHWEP